MKILIFEPHANGHHGPYLDWMVKGLVERKMGVTIVTLQKTLAHPSIHELFLMAQDSANNSLCLLQSPPSADCLPQQQPAGVVGSVASEFDYWRMFRAWYKTYENAVQPDVVFLPYLDYCLYAIGLFGSPFGKCPWVGIAMRPSFHHCHMDIKGPRPALAVGKQALFLRILRNRYLRRLLITNESLVNYLANKWKISDKVDFFPEPTEFVKLPDMVEAKLKLGVEPARKMILLYGAITVRKGVVELLRALANPGFPPTVDVLLAGKIDDLEVKKIWEESWVHALLDEGRLKVIDRFIEPPEEVALFAVADIVWLGYRDHYTSSGVLVQAASAGRSLLACENGVIGWQTRRHGLGKTVNPSDTAEVIAAIKALLGEPSKEPDENVLGYKWQPVSISEAQDTLAQILSDG